MVIFDPDTNDANVRTRGLSFESAEDFDWSTAAIDYDRRRDYGEERFVATGLIDGRLHVLVFTRLAMPISALYRCAAPTRGSRPLMPAEPNPYLTDEENPELTDDQIRAMRPASAMLSPDLYEHLLGRYEARRDGAEEAVVMHLDPDVAARLRADGPGWEERAGEMMRKAVGL